MRNEELGMKVAALPRIYGAMPESRRIDSDVWRLISDGS